MKRLGKERRGPSVNSVQSNTGRFFKTGVISLLLHISLIAFLAFNLKPPVPQGGSSIYRVTLRPFSPPGTGSGMEQTGSRPGASGGLSAPSSGEKLRTEGNVAGSEVTEIVRPLRKKTGKKLEKPEKSEATSSAKKEKAYERVAESEVASGSKNPLKKGEKSKEEKRLGKSFQEAIEDIRKRQALDEIQRRVAQRGKLERVRADGETGGRSVGGQPMINSTQGPILPPTRDSSLSGSRPGTGIGSGSGKGSGAGTGLGTGTAPGRGPGLGGGTGVGSGGSPGGSPWGSPSGSPYGSSSLESKLTEYYSMIWTRIKEEWTLPENFTKGRGELETIVVVVIEREGKVQKMWYDKKSGNTLYDQMAMRAIKKAVPFPPIPKEFTDSTLEIGIRFHPD